MTRAEVVAVLLGPFVALCFGALVVALHAAEAGWGWRPGLETSNGPTRPLPQRPADAGPLPQP